MARESNSLMFTQNPTDSISITPTQIHPTVVEIKKVINGFIVHVGCKTFVSNSWKEVSKGLEEYWKDPAAAEKKYTK